MRQVYSILQHFGYKIKKFFRLYRDTFNNTSKKHAISREATVNLENEIDIIQDVQLLSDFHGFNTITTYSKALIHSQLFEAPLNRQRPHLYTMSEFSKLPKHTNSFVCFHDEGLKHIKSNCYVGDTTYISQMTMNTFLECRDISIEER